MTDLKLKRISRKKFVRRLKKCGWTKKEAKIIARDANRGRTPYAIAWARYMFGGSLMLINRKESG